mmetsp:Transcript_12961/g.39133  ORF Transcript_12961/g.39133 Transcript_12961/m.39133 type:complete len:200 (+) Transcript_12961:137-736(+)
MRSEEDNNTRKKSLSTRVSASMILWWQEFFFLEVLRDGGGALGGGFFCVAGGGLFGVGFAGGGLGCRGLFFGGELFEDFFGVFFLLVFVLVLVVVALFFLALGLGLDAAAAEGLGGVVRGGVGLGEFRFELGVEFRERKLRQREVAHRLEQVVAREAVLVQASDGFVALLGVLVVDVEFLPPYVREPGQRRGDVVGERR